MDSYKIFWRNSAKKELRNLPKDFISKIINSVSELSVNPFPAGVKKLKGNDDNEFRIRIGNYRVIYTVQNDVLIIEVIKVGHRKDIYK